MFNSDQTLNPENLNGIFFTFKSSIGKVKDLCCEKINLDNSLNISEEDLFTFKTQFELMQKAFDTITDIAKKHKTYLENISKRLNNLRNIMAEIGVKKGKIEKAIYCHSDNCIFFQNNAQYFRAIKLLEILNNFATLYSIDVIGYSLKISEESDEKTTELINCKCLI